MSTDTSIYDPKLGDVYRDGHDTDTVWRVEAVGVRTGLVYLRRWREGRPTKSEVEWPRDRWQRFVDNQQLTVAE